MINQVNPAVANSTPITNQTADENSAGRTWFPIIRGDPSLPKDQRNLIRMINLFGLSLCVAGLVLLGVTIPLTDNGSDSELMDSNYRVISSLRFPCLILGASILYFAKLTTTFFKKTNENQIEVSPKLMHEIEQQVKENIHSIEEYMTNPLNSQTVAIDIPQTQQEEELTQQNGTWNRTTMPTSQKGLLISLGICSICLAFAAIAEFFEPDPPPDSLMPSFVDSTVVAKHTQKWSFALISLTTMAATLLYTRYFLQRDQQQAENPTTPEIASIIKSYVEKELINATPESSGLQNLD